MHRYLAIYICRSLFLVKSLEAMLETKCPKKFIKGETGLPGEIGLQGQKGEKGMQGPQGSQGPRGIDGNSAVIMEIVHSKQRVSTEVLSKDQQIKVKELAEKACKEVYR